MKRIWDAQVLRFPRPFPSVQSAEDWVRTVIEADWLFSHGFDTLDIAAVFGMHEADACRAVSQGRAARRNPDGGDGNATAQSAATQTISSGSGQP